MKTLVLVPAYNEEKNISSVIEGIREHLSEADICVVNDGSTDGTREILERTRGITAIHLPFNMGIGGGIWSGFHYFLQEGYDFLVRIDGDGQHPSSEARKLLQTLIDNRADLVIGSRFIKKEGFQSSALRRGGIKLLGVLTRFILKQNITDNTSGFRAYSRRAVSTLVEDYPFDFPEPIEVYLLARRGCRILEVPSTMNERRAGISSISSIQSYYYLIKVMLTIAVNFIGGGQHESLSDRPHPDH
jgi:glycosyltransferase involved in cell wall biosynthesis